MTAISPTAFAAVVWGAIVLVALVFCYEVYAVVEEFPRDDPSRDAQ